MLAKDIQEKLVELAISPLPVKIGMLRASDQDAILVKTSLDGFTVTPEMDGYIRGSLQIIVRHTDPLAGDQLANQIIAALETSNGAELALANYTLTLFSPVTEPIMYPINDAGLFEHSCNFDVAGRRNY